MKNKLFILFIVAICLLPSCRKQDDQVPLVNVEIFMNLNEPQYFDLNAVTGWVYITGGSRGIVVYRNSNEEFTALDRHVPYNVEEGCRIEVSSDNVICDDPCSDSQWLITDGSVLQGPATRALKQYQTDWNSPILHIYN